MSGLVAGKVGVWSKVSKRFVFGICADNKKEARRKLIDKIGYWEAQKYRWEIRPISKRHEEDVMKK